MSLSEGIGAEWDELLRLVDAGASVRSAAVSLGISCSRAYAILQARGRGSGRAKTVVTDEHRGRVLAVFADSGSVNGAAKAAGLSHSAARRILVQAGVMAAEKVPWGKEAARLRFLELVEQGWSRASTCPIRRTGRPWPGGPGPRPPSW
ncbi:hypothetical protein GCM10009525_85410 [Streptosporangium amethystogenes subsp. fukuiense]